MLHGKCCILLWYMPHSPILSLITETREYTENNSIMKMCVLYTILHFRYSKPTYVYGDNSLYIYMCIEIIYFITV